jgi:hypothetical protein
MVPRRSIAWSCGIRPLIWRLVLQDGSEGDYWHDGASSAARGDSIAILLLIGVPLQGRYCRREFATELESIIKSDKTKSWQMTSHIVFYMHVDRFGKSLNGFRKLVEFGRI